MDADTIIAILIATPFIIYTIHLFKSDYENSEGLFYSSKPITPEERQANIDTQKFVEKHNKEVSNDYAIELEEKKTPYVVLISQLDENDDGDMEDLQLSVGVFIKRGWKLQGGVYENSDARYCQAMTKEYE